LSDATTRDPMTRLPAGLNWTPVRSSNIQRVAHDQANNHLYVDFNQRADAPPNIWRYENFTAADHRKLLGAPHTTDGLTLGRHFAQNIKGRMKPAIDDMPSAAGYGVQTMPLNSVPYHPATKIAA
jgi:KTSC domain